MRSRGLTKIDTLLLNWASGSKGFLQGITMSMNVGLGLRSVSRAEVYGLRHGVVCPEPSRYLLYRALGALVPSVVGTWRVRVEGRC